MTVRHGPWVKISEKFSFVLKSWLKNSEIAIAIASIGRGGSYVIDTSLGQD